MSRLRSFRVRAPTADASFATRHAGAWWVRLSAQVYNELEDFAKVGQVLKEVCDKIRRGEMMEMVWRE